MTNADKTRTTRPGDALSSMAWNAHKGQLVPVKGRGLHSLARDRDAEAEWFILSRSRDAGEPYNPLERRTLHRDLADLAGIVPGQQKGLIPKPIEVFVRRYGLLGIGQPVASNVPVPKKAGRKATEEKKLVVEGEALRRWMAVADSLRRAIDLMEAVEGGDRTYLNARIHPMPKAGWRYAERGRGRAAISRIIAMRDDQARTAFITGGNDEDQLLRAATLQLADFVNEGLADHVSKRLVLEPDGRSLRLVDTPDNLVGVAWYQLAREIDDRTAFGRCPGCDRWMDLTHSRKGRTYCSDTCRKRVARRKEQ